MKIKKKYKEAITLTLKCYNLLPAHINDLESRLKEMEQNDGMRGVDYSGDGIRTSNINKMTENTALRNIEDKMEIEKEIVIAKAKLDRLDAAINSLPAIEAEIIKYRYQEGLSWFEVEDKTLYSERSCNRKLIDGICKLAVIFYGDEALEKIAI
ncbi:MAG: hypothetical protein JEZ08_17610 [Clostridiales bacterium]|nr:hypothetical protein [Clostridiales bacterium]